MKLKLDMATLLLLIAASFFAYVLPMEMALVMAADLLTYVEVLAAVYLISRTGAVGGVMHLARRWASRGWERLQLWAAEGMALCVPPFLPPHA